MNRYHVICEVLGETTAEARLKLKDVLGVENIVDVELEEEDVDGLEAEDLDDDDQDDDDDADDSDDE